MSNSLAHLSKTIRFEKIHNCTPSLAYCIENMDDVEQIRSKIKHAGQGLVHKSSASRYQNPFNSVEMEISGLIHKHPHNTFILYVFVQCRESSFGHPCHRGLIPRCITTFSVCSVAPAEQMQNYCFPTGTFRPAYNNGRHIATLHFRQCHRGHQAL
jgi:hypothetical protein